jgi:hypothetical protein
MTPSGFDLKCLADVRRPEPARKSLPDEACFNPATAVEMSRDQGDKVFVTGKEFSRLPQKVNGVAALAQNSGVQ